MNQQFEKKEKLYRAVYPPSVSTMFWKENGTISSAAFADKRGLSVDRGNGRSDETVIADILTRLQGRIISVFAEECWEVDAVVCYLPSSNNRYHSEIHGDEETLLLSKKQRRHLANCAQLVYVRD